jgi:hypothetical protein
MAAGDRLLGGARGWRGGGCAPRHHAVVLKVYPMALWLWLGLGFALGGAALRLAATLYQR